MREEDCEVCAKGEKAEKREGRFFFDWAGEIGGEEEGEKEETERGLCARQVISPLAASRRVSL